MPVLHLEISPAQSPERHLALAQALTALTVECLGKRLDVTGVLVDNRTAGCWYVGAEALRLPTALLEISITQGTNTADEKSAFIEAAFAELQRQLGVDGALEPASYVIVRELPAGDWGYGGITQLGRKRAWETPDA